jgi:membrane dipeptidase
MPLLFDSHLDLAWNALTFKRDLLLPLSELNALDRQQTDERFRGRATVSLPEMKRGQMAVCLATLMGRVPYGSRGRAHSGSLDFPRHENTYAFAHGQLAYYRILAERQHLRILGDRASLLQHWGHWERATDREPLPLGIIIAMEGADAICEPTQAEHWYREGLRVASLVHYGSSKYASGTGDEGPLTEAGRALLDEFMRLGIILDTTHLCDTSFFQVLDYYTGPLLASHQNCRALVPGQRQFSDEQLRLITQRGGIVGLAFDAWMLFPGWQRGETSREVVSIGAAVDHADHICQLAGDDLHVAIGSDLDGGFGTEQSPTGLDSIADLQQLAPLFAARGYSDESIRRIFGENWLRYFSEHLPVVTA